MSMERISHTTYAWPLPGNRKFNYTGMESDAAFIDAAFQDAEKYRKLVAEQESLIEIAKGKMFVKFDTLKVKVSRGHVECSLHKDGNWVLTFDKTPFRYGQTMTLSGIEGRMETKVKFT